jgi:hypothetical protein
MRCKPLLPSVLLAAGVFAAEPAALHPEVAWAVDYRVPEHDCVEPNIRPGNNTATRVERFRRQAKRYTSCVKSYQEGLLADFGRIQDAVRFGVTPDQAESMKANLDAIATRIKSMKETIELVTMTEMEAERLANQGARTSGAQYP